MINRARVNIILQKFLETLENDRKLQDILFIFTYGSTTSKKEYIPNINVGLILKQIEAKELIDFKKYIKGLFKKSRAMPLILTKDEFIRLKTLFPIEFLDMKFRHVKLYGNDFFDEITIDNAELKKYIERELYAKLLKLREVYLATNNAFIYKKIIFKGVSSLLLLLKMIIYLDHDKNREKFKNIMVNKDGSNLITSLDGTEIFNFIKLIYKIDLPYWHAVYNYKYNDTRMTSSKKDYFKGIKEWEEIIKLFNQLK